MFSKLKIENKNSSIGKVETFPVNLPQGASTWSQGKLLLDMTTNCSLR